MASLSFFAGETALARLKQEGLSADMFSAFLGASGGPKWFVLSGLDKVMFNEFLHQSSQHIDIIGSSAGAFRASCFAQDNPQAAIDRLATNYSATVYSNKPSAKEITEKGLQLLDYMMGESGVSEILSSEHKTVHIVCAKCHGLVASEQKAKQLTGLAIAAGRNAVSRSKLQKSFTRVIFSSNAKGLSFSEKVPFNTEQFQLGESNFLPALMASGSIPVVIEGVKNIPSASKGMYRDGGIVDYHFDIQINTPDLVMYPHFNHSPIPGWFDKSLSSRTCHKDSYDNVLLVAPSNDFVANLPYAKIPDRKDFETMDAEQRIKYWRTVIDQSNRLADEFLNVIAKQNIADLIKPINLHR